MERVLFVCLLMIVAATAVIIRAPSRCGKGGRLSQMQCELKKFKERQIRLLAFYAFQNLKNTSPKLNSNMDEILVYFRFLNEEMNELFIRDLRKVKTYLIHNLLRDHCKMNNVFLDEYPTDIKCVKTRLVKWLTAKWKKIINDAQKHASARCAKTEHLICSAEKRNCSLAFWEREAPLLSSLVEDYYDLVVVGGKTIRNTVKKYVVNSTSLVSLPFTTTYRFVAFISHFISSAPSIDPEDFKNLTQLPINTVLSTSIFHNDNFTISHDKHTWGVVRSNQGTFRLPCSSYREIYSRNSSQFLEFLLSCTSRSMLRYSMDFMRCIYKDPTFQPLTFSTATSIYFQSQCLCVAFNGHECGVKAPSGVDPRHYCLSELFRDFQRQVTLRPAVTYLDYALKTRVSVCQFSNLLSVTFNSICQDTAEEHNFYTILSVQCFLKGLVNKELNCSDTLPLNRFNLTELCLAKFFMQFVICDDEAGDEVLVPYYAAGDSPLVTVLTYVDVVARVLTLVTYLTCPQLRNLPGKLLIAYLTTALLRLVLVRATHDDLPLAVRFDVSLDLACTLCLTAYNHFLTSSFKALRPPNSLTRAEALRVLIRFALLGWASPLVLSTAFFSVDEAVVSSVMIGQLMFVLSNYAALLYNLYLFYGAYSCYHDIRSDAEFLRRDAKARGVFVDLFVFALKTSLLSGAGIMFRLVFTQIQGLEHVLGYYHALGTLQGLLLFLLYGCNREGRVFWLGVVSSTLRRYRRRRESSSPRRDSMEMVPMPVA